MCGGWKKQEPRSQLTGALVLALAPTSCVTGANLLISSCLSFLLCKVRSERKGGGLEAPTVDSYVPFQLRLFFHESET